MGSLQCPLYLQVSELVDDRERKSLVTLKMYRVHVWVQVPSWRGTGLGSLINHSSNLVQLLVLIQHYKFTKIHKIKMFWSYV